MAYIPRSGLFGFLLLLAALAPSAGMAANSAAPTHPDSPSFSSGPVEPAAAVESVDARLRRISAALREREDLDAAATPGSTDDKLAWVFANGPGIGFRNGGFRNGGWGNGGFRNGGFGNGGFRNGGWGNGGGFRNGGFLNRW
jgi:rSAM-associated Gly-rich repeat protein